MLRVAALILIHAAGCAVAAPPELSGRIAAVHPAGCAEYRLLLIELYRAELWTDSVTPPGQTFALSVIYRRGFGRETLVSSSISEMARMSGRPTESFDAARVELGNAMRTVRKGDRLTAWHGASGAIEFFHNGEATGQLTHDPDLFLNIWLGPESRDPGRAAKLLGGRCDG